MIKNYLKIALRNIGRQKLYTFINITGLGVASAFCILVYLYVNNERSFDNFHHDQNQLYRVEMTDIFGGIDINAPKQSNFFSFLMKDAEQKYMIQTPTAMAPDLKRNFPEVENAVRFEDMGDETVTVGNQSFHETGSHFNYVDAGFFTVFNYPLISGNPTSVITQKNQIAISERLAEKYFGKADPIGKVITLPNETGMPPLVVNGVFKNFPSNSSFQFDLVMARENSPGYKDDVARGVNTFSDNLVIKLKKGTDPRFFEQKLNAFGVSYFKPLYAGNQKLAHISFNLRPLADAHYNESVGWYHYTDLKNIYQLICLTVVILLIACLNYILLTLTNTVSRSQDVGIRKTIGASRFRIILQYYTETQLLASFSVIAGLLIAIACLPFFGKLTGSPVDLGNIPYLNIGLFLFGLAVALGLVAGIYPSMAMSGLKPLSIMKSFSAYKINPILSRVLIVLQFSVCIILIVSSLVINSQMRYINNASMGFDKDEVLTVESPYYWTDKAKFKILKQRMQDYAGTDAGIADFTASSFVFAGYNNNAYEIGGEKVMLQAINVDYNFFSFLKIPMVAGRAFSSSIVADSAKLPIPEHGKFSAAGHNIVVNQTLYNLLGKPAVGEFDKQMGGVIIGVCKDYHSEDFTRKIQPAYYTVNKGFTGTIWIKIRKGQNISAEIEKIHAVWNKFTGNLPFTFTFMDEEVAKSYDAFLRWMSIITTSCVIAIILACLGLFGLSGLAAINRTKEIGIRKVLGAPVSTLFMLLNRETFILSGIAFILAVPGAIYFTQKWLESFAYRIHDYWPLFVISGALSVATGVLAVSYHTIRASRANPVDALRSE